MATANQTALRMRKYPDFSARRSQQPHGKCDWTSKCPYANCFHLPTSTAESLMSFMLVDELCFYDCTDCPRFDEVLTVTLSALLTNCTLLTVYHNLMFRHPPGSADHILTLCDIVLPDGAQLGPTCRKCQSRSDREPITAC